MKGSGVRVPPSALQATPATAGFLLLGALPRPTAPPAAITVPQAVIHSAVVAASAMDRLSTTPPFECLDPLAQFVHLLALDADDLQQLAGDLIPTRGPVLVVARLPSNVLVERASGEVAVLLQDLGGDHQALASLSSR